MDSRNFPRLSNRSYRPDDFSGDRLARGQTAHRATVLAQVTAKYAARRQAASADERQVVDQLIRAEVEKRLRG